ncbi:MAG: nucleoside hydrolase [Clostridia bacterium]|nr:nucleoside hydrolase [Clostridia bacterium]
MLSSYDRLIMFCDYGLDDAVATLHILGRAELFGRIDVVPIGGNVSAETAYRNAQTLLASADHDTEKVRIVDTRDIPQRYADIPDVHGGDGMGDILAPAVSKCEVVAFDAFAAEMREGRGTEKTCLLSLGPCTLPVALGIEPNSTVLMGGTTKEPPNYGEYEFNEGMDVVAFARLAGSATAVATLDTCHNCNVDFEHRDFGGKLAARLVSRYIELCKARNAPLAVYDYVAALAVTDPQLFVTERITRKDGVTYEQLKINN